MNRGPTPITLWAVVVIGTRVDWINWHTIRRTRKGAVDAYLEGWLEHYRAEHARQRGKKRRVQRVTVHAEGRG